VSYIDWSDAEELFGLLVEFVEDELGESHDDPMRRRFLAKLDSDLMALQERITTMTPDESIAAFEEIQGSLEDDFEKDPVVEHLGAFVEELRRIRGEAAAQQAAPPDVPAASSRRLGRG
jgi:hypothetical protein